MANLRRVKPSKNVEDKRGRAYPDKETRQSQIQRDRQSYSESKGLTHGPDRVDRVVEQGDKSRRLENNNMDRQTDIKTQTASIRKQISRDYTNFLYGKKK